MLLETWLGLVVAVREGDDEDEESVDEDADKVEEEAVVDAGLTSTFEFPHQRSCLQEGARAEASCRYDTHEDKEQQLTGLWWR